MTRDQMGGWVVAKKDTNPTKVISLSPAGCARGKAQVGQKLLPKDCLPAAPGPSESPGGPKPVP